MREPTPNGCAHGPVIACDLVVAGPPCSLRDARGSLHPIASVPPEPAPSRPGAGSLFSAVDAT